MYSDNENPGAEISAGQTAAAAITAPEPNTPTAQTEETPPPAAEAEAQDAIPQAAPATTEPAAVTVSPTEPVATPDGAAAVEHSDVSTGADSGHPIFADDSTPKSVVEVNNQRLRHFAGEGIQETQPLVD